MRAPSRVRKNTVNLGRVLRCDYREVFVPHSLSSPSFDAFSGFMFLASLFVTARCWPIRRQKIICAGLSSVSLTLAELLREITQLR